MSVDKLSDKNTAGSTLNIATNLTPDISKTTETEVAVEKLCTKQVVVLLHRLSESTINRILSRRSPSSESGNKLSKEILEKCLLPKLESRLTSWIKGKFQKNNGRLLTRKVIKKAKRIFERLKAQGGEKYRNVNFVPTRRWFYRYRIRAGWYDKQHLVNLSLHQNCNCSVVDDIRNGSLTSVLESSSDEDECSHTVNSDADEDWCSRLKSDLINEKARDLMIDTLTSCPFLSCTNTDDQENNITEVSREELIESKGELFKRCQTPMPNFDPDMELDSSSCGSYSDQLEISEIVFCPKASSREDITDKSVDAVMPVVITIDDEERPQMNPPSTISVAAFARNGYNSNENKFVEVGSNPTQVPFFKSVSPENESVVHFRQKFEKIIKQEKYLPQQIFCAQETTLFWKHLPANCGVLEPMIGELPESKDPMMMLLCTNASGDCRFEPMLVYSEEDPSSIRHLIKSSLPVIWKFHPRAKITNSLFEDWFTYSFIPTVQVYCIEHRIPFQALLVLDIASCHNPVLEFAHPNVKVVFLSPNIAPFIQPMELGIITTFKVNYLKRMFEMIAECTELDGETTQSFWNSFNILSALKLIKSAWLDVSQIVVTLAWRIMCLGTLPKDSEEGNCFSNAVALTISAAKNMKVNLSERDITNWLYYQSHELTNDELKALEQRNSVEAASSGTETPVARITPSKLLEALKYLKSAMKIFELEDPNYKRSSYVNEEIRRSCQCYHDMYSELKKPDGLENDASGDGVKVEDDRPPLMTDVNSSPSMLAKWLSTSSIDSTQESRFQLTCNGINEQNSL